MRQRGDGRGRAFHCAAALTAVFLWGAGEDILEGFDTISLGKANIHSAYSKTNNKIEIILI